MPAHPLPRSPRLGPSATAYAPGHVPAPAALCAALAEIDEFAARAPHLDFRAARSRSLVDALRNACKLSDPAGPAAHC